MYLSDDDMHEWHMRAKNMVFDEVYEVDDDTYLYRHDTDVWIQGYRGCMEYEVSEDQANDLLSRG